MKILLLIIFLFIANCNLTKVVDNHGVHYLDKKQKNLVVNKTNRNDIIKILGPPSTKSQFNNDLWIYIEAQQKGQTLLKFGNKKLYTNNVLMLEINNKGLLAKKEFFNINDMNKLKFSENETTINYSKKSFVYDFLASMRQRVNDPLGVRKNKK